MKTFEEEFLIDVKEVLGLIQALENKHTPYAYFVLSGNEQAKISVLIENWETLKQFLVNKINPEKQEQEHKAVKTRQVE